MRLLFIVIFFFSVQLHAQYKSDTLLLDSKVLGDKIKVISFKLTASEEASWYYFTDGIKLLDNGYWNDIKKLTKKGKIHPANYVFVGSVDMNDGVDKRNEYFFCNSNYLKFFEKELVDRLEPKYEEDTDRRYLLGISFGGLSAAYFSAQTDLFSGYGLLSPITYPCEEIHEKIVFSKNTNLKIYLSSGKTDAEFYVEKLHALYNSKKYKVEVNYTEGGHDFENWRGQLEQVINFLQ